MDHKPITLALARELAEALDPEHAALEVGRACAKAYILWSDFAIDGSHAFNRALDRLLCVGGSGETPAQIKRAAQSVGRLMRAAPEQLAIQRAFKRLFSSFSFRITWEPWQIEQEMASRIAELVAVAGPANLVTELVAVSLRAELHPLAKDVDAVIALHGGRRRIPLAEITPTGRLRPFLDAGNDKWNVRASMATANLERHLVMGGPRQGHGAAPDLGLFSLDTGIETPKILVHLGFADRERGIARGDLLQALVACDQMRGDGVPQAAVIDWSIAAAFGALAWGNRAEGFGFSRHMRLLERQLLEMLPAGTLPALDALRSGESSLHNDARSVAIEGLDFMGIRVPLTDPGFSRPADGLTSPHQVCRALLPFLVRKQLQEGSSVKTLVKQLWDGTRKGMYWPLYRPNAT